mmetsp:Transcript_15806/g.24268  ORF Transcript_15806/g.24268 Transcript_15806/m.24268 type:complete len:391 (+) Transcript_15806:93-1265(+)
MVFNRSRQTLLLFTLATYLSGATSDTVESKGHSLRRRLQEEPATGALTQANEQVKNRKTHVEFNLPGSAAEWCSPPILPPLPYEECKDKTKVNSVPLYGGLTNSLKMVLLGAIKSFEEDRCFFVDESGSELGRRNDPRQSIDSIIDRYFEPIGIKSDSEAVKTAKTNNAIDVRDWKVVWEIIRNRRQYGETYNIDSLNYPNIEGHNLKYVMLRRMWRPLPHIRDQTCTSLGDHVQGDEFMTFSVRRGDKGTENFAFATPQQYIDMAEKAIRSHFGGQVPTIFVATDDCTIMEEFREMRPTWKFVSECDKEQTVGHSGFALGDMKQWSQKDTDAHYAKFFVELYAMATAKYFIGVWYTNVSWWAYFMREADRTTYLMLDTPGTEMFSLDWS